MFAEMIDVDPRIKRGKVAFYLDLDENTDRRRERLGRASFIRRVLSFIVVSVLSLSAACEKDKLSRSRAEQTAG